MRRLGIGLVIGGLKKSGGGIVVNLWVFWSRGRNSIKKSIVSQEGAPNCCSFGSDRLVW